MGQAISNTTSNNNELIKSNEGIPVDIIEGIPVDVIKDIISMQSSSLQKISEMLTAGDIDKVKDIINKIRKLQLVKQILWDFSKVEIPLELLIVIVFGYADIFRQITSNEISNRHHSDGARNMDLIDTTFKAKYDGTIVEWRYFARHPATLYGTVWRDMHQKDQRGKKSYKLIGINKFPQHKKNNKICTHRPAMKEKIMVKKDDFIGIRWDGSSSIPSGLRTGHLCHWKTNVVKTPIIGEKRVFDIGDSRDYAYGFVLER